MKIDIATVGKVAMTAFELFLQILSSTKGKKSAFGVLGAASAKVLDLSQAGRSITPKAIQEIAKGFARAGGQTTITGKQPGALDAAADALAQFKAMKDSGHGADFHLDQAATQLRVMAVSAAMIASELYSVSDKWGQE